MEDLETKKLESNFVCFRCGCIIKPGEQMVSFSIDLETPTEDNELKIIESVGISTLCTGCASVLLTQAITSDPSLMMPLEQDSGIVEYDDEISSNEDEEGKPRASLSIRHSSKGFCLELYCGDGISEATSRFFTWRQLAQMLIAMDPDMFGVLDEPLHQVFPRALSRLGYHVPNWKDLQEGTPKWVNDTTLS